MKFPRTCVTTTDGDCIDGIVVEEDEQDSHLVCHNKHSEMTVKMQILPIKT